MQRTFPSKHKIEAGHKEMTDSIQKFNISSIRSLCWSEDTLVDWVGGGRTLSLDGHIEDSRVRYAFGFDAAVTSPCGHFAVIYQKLGTKGVILRDGKFLREINRSFYHADAYEYPIAIFRTKSERVLIAHCPDEYCQLELEDIETGERLTASEDRKPSDFFHSRLRVSPDGKWMLSAGWLWHPWGTLAVFDIEAALLDPKMLDCSASLPPIEGEVSAAEFLPDSQILLWTSDETLSGDDADPVAIGKNSIAIINPLRNSITSCIQVAEPVGTLMPIDTEFAVGFYEHPKLISLKSGEVTMRWTAINSGNQTSSILLGDITVPPIACDSKNKRFAVADGDSVSVVDLRS